MCGPSSLLAKSRRVLVRQAARGFLPLLLLLSPVVAPWSGLSWSVSHKWNRPL